MAKKPVEKSAEVRAQVLADYQNRALTTDDIAKKYGVSIATVTVWAKKAGLCLRSRGRWTPVLPSDRHAKIIELAKTLTYREVGERMNLHKQAVHRIVKRWEAREKLTEPPFLPGDRIIWNGRKFSVEDAGLHTGTVIDEQGKRYVSFAWNSGTFPRKIGVDPKFVVKGVARRRVK